MNQKKQIKNNSTKIKGNHKIAINYQGSSTGKPIKYNEKPIIIEDLQTKTPNEIVSFINSNIDWFNNILNASYVENNFCLYLSIISKTCDLEIIETLYTFLEHLLNVNERFLNDHIMTYLLETQRRGINEICLKNIVKLIETLQKLHPHSSIKTSQILLPLIRDSASRLDNNSGIILKLDELDSVKNSLLDDYNFIYNGGNAAIEVPNDFRDIPIFPDKQDLIVNTRPFLRPSIVEGRYANPNHYLDVQFRLLREDFVRPLRQGIAAYLDQINSRPNQKLRLDDVRLYRDVTLVQMIPTDEGVIHDIKFDTYPLRNVQWETSKRLIYGSLVCLTCDDFKSFFFGTVANRVIEKLKDGVVSIKFESPNIIMDVQHQSFIMVESEAYFEASRHILLSLQNIDESNFPLKEYIVELRKKVEKPGYLNENSVFCFGNLVDKVTRKITEQKSTPDQEWLQNIKPKNSDFEMAVRNKKGSKPKTSLVEHEDVSPDRICNCMKNKEIMVEIFSDNAWPSSEDFKLDQSQCEALKTALRQKLCVIQGPPGTGKTFIGIKILEALLHNKKAWNETSDDDKRNPILVVCYTNHALDQFMEGVLKITDRVVRVGSRSSSEALKPYSMNVLRKCLARNMKFELEYVLKQIKAHENKIIFSESNVLSDLELKACMSESQYQSLQCHMPVKLRSRDRMKTWLGIEPVTDSEAANHDGNPKAEEHNLTRTKEKSYKMDFELLENGLDIEELQDRYVPIKQTNRRRVILIENNKNKTNNIKYPEITPNPDLDLTDKQLLNCTNVWRSLDLANRARLYKLWVEIYKTNIKKEISNLKRVYEYKLNMIETNSSEIDIMVAKSALVIGMTTTGAAKHRNLINNMKSQIVIVEEAAEVLEAHIVSSLSPHTQQLILIGDHQQLRPNPVVYELAKKYNLEISLFERLIKNGVPFVKLQEQHRMRPDISRLLVPHIYNNLQNHKSVQDYENMLGFKQNVFFLNHNKGESQEMDSKSRVNMYEAEFLVALCSYILQQGYKPSQITILTTYLGQLVTLKSLLTGKLRGVKANVVDNYQGEENDIILISFVRSNHDGDIGFLKTENRVCVALSRAKMGLYCVGNFNLLAERSTLWAKITHDLWESKAIGNFLMLKCQNHGEINYVSKPSDFDQILKGGCSKLCDYRLKCGHSCGKKCHPMDDHDKAYCVKPCQRFFCGHKCSKLCGQVCDPCEIMVTRMSNCGRKYTIPCHIESNAHDENCKLPCVRIIHCGHKCNRKCSEVCADSQDCKVLVNISSPCQHMVQIQCKSSKDEDMLRAYCKELCQSILPCGHQCDQLCSLPCQPLCNFTVIVQQPCGHKIEQPCHKLKGSNTCLRVLDCGHPCSGEVKSSCKEKNCIAISSPKEPSFVTNAKAINDIRHREVVFKIIKPNPLGQKSCVDSRKSSSVRNVLKVQHRNPKAKGAMTITVPNSGQRQVELLTSVEKHPMLKCGHPILIPGETNCFYKVKVSLPCGHQTETDCFKSMEKVTECQTVLKCGHKCICQRRKVALCVERCKSSDGAEKREGNVNKLITQWLKSPNRR